MRNNSVVSQKRVKGWGARAFFPSLGLPFAPDALWSPRSPRYTGERMGWRTLPPGILLRQGYAGQAAVSSVPAFPVRPAPSLLSPPVDPVATRRSCRYPSAAPAVGLVVSKPDGRRRGSMGVDGGRVPAKLPHRRASPLRDPRRRISKATAQARKPHHALPNSVPNSVDST